MPKLLSLRAALGLDAATGALNALAYLLLAGPLSAWLGIPATALLGLGAFLVAFGLGVGWLASQAAPPRAAVQAVIAVNLAWMLGSLAVLVDGLFPLTGLGAGWVVAQTMVVGFFSLAQWATLPATSPRLARERA